MGLFDRLFGRKKEKKEDIREEVPVQTEVSETEDAIEELENENCTDFDSCSFVCSRGGNSSGSIQDQTGHGIRCLLGR